MLPSDHRIRVDPEDLQDIPPPPPPVFAPPPPPPPPPAPAAQEQQAQEKLAPPALPYNQDHQPGNGQMDGGESRGLNGMVSQAILVPQVQAERRLSMP